MSTGSGAEIRAAIGHPVVDADGHTIEFLPHIHDLIRDIGGNAAIDGWLLVERGPALASTLDLDTRRQLGLSRVSWWGLPAEHTRDRATGMLPALMYERLDELGVDFAVLYPTYGLVVMGLDDPETRVAAARAFNTYYAEAFASLRDRLEPVAIVPTVTPGEAVETIDHAIGTLGLKAVMCTGIVHRPVPGAEQLRAARWLDALGLDSAYDFDPFWARCAELGVSPTFHSTGMGWGSRVSPTNYMANHLGSFAAAGEALCRSLFMGGVLHRFPTLRFAFLEGGVAWAAELCANLVGHWEKRHSDVIGRYDPGRLDRTELRRLAEQYGGAGMRDRLDRFDDALRMLSDPDDHPTDLDEFAAAGITAPDDVRRAFATQCFFGCEADDPLVALAFEDRLAGTRLPAMFASDIGHWDVPDVRGVLPEAFELVDDGHLSPADFRAFTFEHAVRLWGETNPQFFAGTAVQADAATLLAG